MGGRWEAQRGMERMPDRSREVEENLWSARAAGPAVLTVGQLNRWIGRVVDSEFFDDVHVVGQVSNYRPNQRSGHVYFTLRDEEAEIPAVMWQSQARRLRFTPENGLEVVATGHVEFYQPRGRIQLIVRQLEPRGVGALELAFRQLYRRLEREGLFEDARKRALPPFPQRIGVVTSPTGAAVRDILVTLRRRFPGLHIFVVPVRVQGDGAAEEIARAIANLNRWSAHLGGIDVMIVGRGGGSQEDLWAFNEEVVARAIAQSRIPVVSAVGHEIDTTIADLVADVRAATPTAAAQIVVPDAQEVLRTIERHARSLMRTVAHRLEMERSRLRQIERAEPFARPLAIVERARQRVDEAAQRLEGGWHRRARGWHDRLHHAARVLVGLHPLRVMRRMDRQVEMLRERLGRAVGRCLDRAEAGLAGLERRLAGRHPGMQVGMYRREVRAAERRLAGAARRRVRGWAPVLDEVHRRLERAPQRLVEALAKRTETAETRLRVNSYRSVLRRGYAIVRRRGRKRLVTRSADARPGEVLTTEMFDGSFESQVIERGQGVLFGEDRDEARAGEQAGGSPGPVE